jgi:hypothetical protein
MLDFWSATTLQSHVTEPLVPRGHLVEFAVHGQMDSLRKSAAGFWGKHVTLLLGHACDLMG